jgi:hypothetical protein
VLSCFTDCILVRCWLLLHWLYFASMLTCFTDCILIQCWLMFHWLYFGSMLTIVSSLNQNTVSETIVNIEPKYSQWNNSQHWIKIQSVKQVNIEAKYSQWNNSQHWTKIVNEIIVNIAIVSLTAFWFNVDYCFIDCILAQWWLLFHWLFWFNVDYCFTDCILLQCWLASLTVFWFNVDYCFIDCILVQCWLLFHWLYLKYSQWNNSQHWTKI